MINSILEYIRAWFPANESPFSTVYSRKRRGSDNNSLAKSPKYRKVLSSLTNNVEDDLFTFPLRSSFFGHRAERPTIIDDEPVMKPVNNKPSRERKSLENQNGDDDLIYLKTVKSTTEKKLDAKKAGFEYITRFSSTREPITPKSGAKNGATPKSSTKNKSVGRFSLDSSYASPTMNYSVRLSDKKKYQTLLDHVAAQNSFDYSFLHKSNNSSKYSTPRGSLDRSRRLIDLSRSPRSVEVVDLTSDSKTRLSTKDTVQRVLDNFETEPEIIEDSDSDVEILPSPPSPRPDVKVSPVNSLKTVVDTSKVSRHEWLQDVTSKHEKYLVDKSKEIQAYEENSSTLNEINRSLLIKSLSKKVQDSLAISEAILPIEEDAETELPPLTGEDLKLVKRAQSGDPNEVLTKKFNLHITRRDMQTLAGLTWLNDNVINFYMNLIIERGSDPNWPSAYAMNTFFYQKLTTSGPDSLKRWTRKVDLFSYEFICVPIHLGIHWCMAIINLKAKTIKYYDSMGNPNNHCLEALRNYLEFEHQDKKNQVYSTKDFVLENVKNIPQQMNGSDCGMFSCTFAEFATRKAKFNFCQEDMPYLRKKMMVEILKGELLIK